MKIEVWSDVVCPWCYIGKRRLEAALEQFRADHPEERVEVAYRAFLLDPTAPVGVDQSVREVYDKKFGGAEQAQALIDRVTDEAAGEGLEFRLDIARRSNTVLAHRLLVLAEIDGCQEELKERLMRAYFSEGRSLGDPAVLVELAAEVGLDEEQARGWLAGDGGRAEVADALEFAASAGISSVPTFVINRQVGVPGAQPPEVLVQVLEQVASS